MLAPWKESCEKPRQHIKKQRHHFTDKDITLLTKVCIVIAMIFPVVMYGCQSWTIRKFSAFWYWRRLLRVPWIARRPNLSILKEISPEYSLEGLMLKLTICRSPDVKSWMIGKNPDAGKLWRQEEKGTTENEMVGWHHWLDGHEFEQALGVGYGQGSLVFAVPGVARVRHNWVTELK